MAVHNKIQSISLQTAVVNNLDIFFDIVTFFVKITKTLTPYKFFHNISRR